VQGRLGQHALTKAQRAAWCAVACEFLSLPKLGESFTFIGLLPAPNECVSQATRLNFKKLKELKKLKRHRHVARESSRIFIRTVQQVNGWADRLCMFASSALIPDVGAAASALACGLTPSR
jgi:hypothetical protein